MSEKTSWSNDDVSDGSELVMNFATDEVKPDAMIPDGFYPVIILKVEVKNTKPKDGESEGSGKIATFQLKITEGDFKGRTLFDGINVLNKNEQAENIGRRQLAGLLEAIGKKGETNLAKTVQCECLAKVRTQPEQNGYEARNIVRGYKSAGGVALPSASPQTEEQKKNAPGFMAKKTAAAGGPPQLQK